MNLESFGRFGEKQAGNLEGAYIDPRQVPEKMIWRRQGDFSIMESMIKYGKIDFNKGFDPICVRPVSEIELVTNNECDRFKDPVIFYRNEGVLCNTFQISYDGWWKHSNPDLCFPAETKRRQYDNFVNAGIYGMWITDKETQETSIFIYVTRINLKKAMLLLIRIVER